MNIAEAALESDAHYFKLAAEQIDLPGATLVWMPGLNHMASAAVTTNVDLDADPEIVLPAIEHACFERMLAVNRIYLSAHAPVWEQTLTKRGYLMREEVVQAAPPGVRNQWSKEKAFLLQRVESNDDWVCRRVMYEKDGRGSDGYFIEINDYIEMEKRKSVSEDLTYYLLCDRYGEVKASCGLMMYGNIARLKNLVVHPAIRGKGVAGRFIHAFSQMIPEEAVMICYWIGSGSRTSPYERMGFKSITSCFEWSKRINLSC